MNVWVVVRPDELQLARLCHLVVDFWPSAAPDHRGPRQPLTNPVTSCGGAGVSGQDNRSGFCEFSATLPIPGGGIASPIVIRLEARQKRQDWMGPPTLDWMGPPTLRYQGNVAGTFRRWHLSSKEMWMAPFVGSIFSWAPFVGTFRRYCYLENPGFEPCPLRSWQAGAVQFTA